MIKMSNLFPIGLSMCDKKPLDEKGFIELYENGIEIAELSEGYADEYALYDARAIKSAAQKAGVSLWSLHLPFYPFEIVDPSSLDREIRNYTVSIFTEIIKRWSDIGIDKFIIHPSGEPIDDSVRAERLKYSAQSLSLIAETAARRGSVIAVEDLPRTCLGRNSEEIRFLLLANDKLRVCFDTNHLLSEKIPDFIKSTGNKIITTHISDYDFVNERHWLPGEGYIDWQELLNALKAVGYKGPWLYELGLDAPASIKRRTLTYKDFYDNAITVFSGERPASIGKRTD